MKQDLWKGRAAGTIWVVLLIACVVGCSKVGDSGATKAGAVEVKASVNHQQTTEDSLFADVILANVSESEVALSKAVSWVGLNGLLQVHVAVDGKLLIDPEPLARLWPYSVLPAPMFDLKEPKVVRLAPGESYEISTVEVPLPDRGTYRVWFTLFLPRDGVEKGTEWGADPGPVLRSNTLVIARD